MVTTVSERGEAQSEPSLLGAVAGYALAGQLRIVVSMRRREPASFDKEHSHSQEQH